MIYFETNSTNPAYNLAFEEYLLNNKRDGEILILWQNDNAIIIGQNQNALAEINKYFVEENNVRVIRRVTGGGAVYHDLGNLNYSFITDAKNKEKLNLKSFTKPVISALLSLGLDASASGRNDILVDGKKISGTAQRIVKNRMLFHGTLLFDSNTYMISNALNADPLKFKSKASASVKARVTNIKEHLNRDMDINAFWDYVREYLLKSGAAKGVLSDFEMEEINCLKEEKYDTWQWNFGHSPKYETSKKAAFPGGIVEVNYTVDRGVLKDIEFYGDFLSRKSLDIVKEALRGINFKETDIKKALYDIKDFSDYFGLVSVEEIAGLLFS